MELSLDDLTVRALSGEDAPLLVEATRSEVRRSMWDATPLGPYSSADAEQALAAWERAGHTSYGLLRDGVLLGAVGVMPDGPSSAELAYWVRPEERGRGLAARGVQAVTALAHARLGIARAWLEIDPANAASLRVAERAGYTYEERLAGHCGHDCLIWSHAAD